MKTPHLLLCSCALAGVAFLAGCGHSKPTPASGSEAEGHGHAYEHHNPPHKPRDFPTGLAALRERLTSFFKAPASPTPEADQEFTKLVDIVGWLPELAADSDLERAEWDRVNEQSKQLARDVNAFAHTGSEDARRRLRQQVEIALQALEEIVHRHPGMFGTRAGVPGARDSKLQDAGLPKT
jgi:hypothetical protein